MADDLNLNKTQCTDCRWEPIDGRFCCCEKCPFYIGLEESQVYKRVLLRYYETQMEADTDYVRSDVLEENGGEKCGLKDRVWLKIENIKESDRSYSGQYMMEYIFYHLRDNDRIGEFDPSDFRDMVREQRYIISKSSFQRWWNCKIEEYEEWKKTLLPQDIILRKERKVEKDEKRRASARLSMMVEEITPRKYF